MASSHKEIAARKHKLLERFRASLLEETLEDGREQAMVERENDRFAWKSAFRPREEIMVLYRERKKWDRRFLIDSAGLTIVLALIVLFTPILVRIVAPKSNWERDARVEMDAAQNPATPSNPTEGVPPLGEE